ncbi:restriction endonuclease subunit S [Lentimicrobium sp. S6]|uniref:restriction endonuclease subunit S n=1 Tax=Lentimicrobium sp. S6 TaxID=2735872 RepID=UPI0015536F68|nr:restriction endonuclease subunit S [Lentimicrobium sp. S6]NPD48168.1 restriction endonuclease subunit S [Lentimicrobium sp. S6]
MGNPIKDLTTKIGSGATPRGGQASYKESGISLIRSMNVHDDGFRKKKLAFIDDSQARKLDNVTVFENDVLLNITGASVARCCVVDNTFLPARVNQHVSIIRLKDGILNHQFLHYALTSRATKDLLLGIGEQGATRQAITKVQIENFKIKYPSNVTLQEKLVHSLNNTRTISTKLIDSYQKKIKALKELKKSILQKAFSGELTMNYTNEKTFEINQELRKVAEEQAHYKHPK